MKVAYSVVKDRLMKKFEYHASLLSSQGNVPIRKFGLEKLQKKAIIIAPDTINSQESIDALNLAIHKGSKKKELKILTIVDVQNDFVNGSLKVEGAEKIFEGIMLKIKEENYDIIALTADNHPLDHVSFAKNHAGVLPFTGTYRTQGNRNTLQMAWPEHCVQGTFGAEIELRILNMLNDSLPKTTDIFFFPKGEGSSETYSAGENVVGERQPYLDFLECLAEHFSLVVDHVGLAADYCVALSAKSASSVANTQSRVIGKGTVAIHKDAGNQNPTGLSERQAIKLFHGSDVIYVQ